MNTQGKVTASVRNDFRATNTERWGGSRKVARAKRVEEHRQGVDHGPGCVHCDVTHNR